MLKSSHCQYWKLGLEGVSHECSTSLAEFTVLCQEWRSLACSFSLSLYLFFAPYLSPSFSPHLRPTTSPLFLIFPHFKAVQMALPSVGILDFPVSRSMSNNFPYNFLRLWHSIITAQNWVAKKCLQKTWDFYIRKKDYWQKVQPDGQNIWASFSASSVT